MNDYEVNGRVSLLGSVFLGMFSWFTPENVDLTLKVITGIGALASAILASRYYWYATKEKKQSIRKMKDE